MAAQSSVAAAEHRWGEGEAGPVWDGFSHLVGTSTAMQQVIHQAQCAAEGDFPVLLLGEKGTGKRLIAETIHRNSERRHRPMISVRVATIPVVSMESQLFGSAGGGTGSRESRITGDVAAADGGSLFIDEVSSLTRTSQAKLLCLLEKRTVTPIGDDAVQNVDVRLLAASSRDLDELVEQGRFRADLNYRLNVIAIHLPPLRQRREDIAPLVRCCLEEICDQEGFPPVQPGPELMRLLEGYDWPGNVRQLQDCLRNMVFLARRDRLMAGDWYCSVPRADKTPDGSQLRHEKRLAELERRAMLEALEQHGGNRTCAAEALGISVRTLQRKLKKWNAERTAKPSPGA